jgi:UDP:flavonoid glycosyltransferase YjiC (YdhE family)
MKIMFTMLSWPTHYYPLVSTAWACRAAGHDVLIAAQPAVADAVVRSGMSIVAVGNDFDVLKEMGQLHRQAHEQGLAPDSETVRSFARIAHTRSAAATVDDLIAVGRDWRPDVVISDQMVLAAPLVAEALGVPLIRHLYGTDAMRELGFPGSGLPLGEWPDELLALFDKYGSTPRVEFATSTIDPCPAPMQVAGIPGRVGVRPVPYNSSGVLPRWLLEPVERPRVLVTWGTASVERQGAAKFLVPQVLDAMAGMDVDVVVAMRGADRHLVGAAPVDYRVLEDVPLHAVLPGCSAIVHHGGSGNILAAAYNGVPQVAVPMFLDNSIYVRHLASTGAAISLPPTGIEAGEVAGLRDAITSALRDPEVRAAADALHGEILATPSPAEVVADLPALF